MYSYIRIGCSIPVLQDRLNKQQEDTEQERQRLQELVARLEAQIREQTRMLEEVTFTQIYFVMIVVAQTLAVSLDSARTCCCCLNY